MGGYRHYLDTLPARIDTPCGARAQLAKAFIGSAEFAALGVSDAEYVDMLYRAFLLREPDAAGKANWMRALQGTTRTHLVDLFCNSSEGHGLYGG